jgi:hypothetical protein
MADDNNLFPAYQTPTFKTSIEGMTQAVPRPISEGKWGIPAKVTGTELSEEGNVRRTFFDDGTYYDNYWDPNNENIVGQMDQGDYISVFDRDGNVTNVSKGEKGLGGPVGGFNKVFHDIPVVGDVMKVSDKIAWNTEPTTQIARQFGLNETQQSDAAFMAALIAATYGAGSAGAGGAAGAGEAGAATTAATVGDAAPWATSVGLGTDLGGAATAGVGLGTTTAGVATLPAEVASATPAIAAQTGLTTEEVAALWAAYELEVGTAAAAGSGTAGTAVVGGGAAAAGGTTATGGATAAGTGSLTVGGFLDYLAKGIAVAGSATALYTAVKGQPSQTVSSTTTTSNLPSYMQGGAQQLWDDYINDFYGLGGGKSVKTMMGEDTSYVAGLDKNLAAMAGKQVSDMESGTGMFTPTNISFGGNPAFSFVPRSNRDLAKQQLTTGGVQNELLKPHTPNEASMAYNTYLGNLALNLNKGAGSTGTTTGTVPGTSSTTNVNNTLNTAGQLIQALNNYNTPSSSTTTTQPTYTIVKNADGQYVLTPK